MFKEDKVVTYRLQCACGTLSHQVLFQWWSDLPLDGDLFITVVLPYTTWRERLRSAWRMLTGDISPYVDVAEVLLRPEDVPPLIAYLEGYVAAQQAAPTRDLPPEAHASDGDPGWP